MSLVSDAQWAVISPLLAASRPSRRRSPVGDRWAFEGILWLVAHRERWASLPARFPSAATCWRRLRDWERSGAWQVAWREYLATLDGLMRRAWEDVLAGIDLRAGRRRRRPKTRQRLCDRTWVQEVAMRVWAGCGLPT